MVAGFALNTSTARFNEGAWLSYYHVRITERGQRHDEVKNDLDEATLEHQFLDPYRNGRPITINGRVIQPENLDRIRINFSEVPSAQIIGQLQIEDRMSNVDIIDRPSDEWRAADRATDVTDQFITGPPGITVPTIASPGRTQVPNTLNTPIGPGDRRSIFVINGRDSEATGALVQVLRALNLRIIEWEHAVSRTGLPNPYVGDVVFAGLQMADAALVVLTPDDLVQLRPDLLHSDDGDLEQALQGQARPNVFYEAGIADAYGRERTVIVEVGPSKPFSDVSGRHVVRYDGSPARRNALVERLSLAGLEPDRAGSDWLNVGDVSSSIEKARRAMIAARKPSSP